MSYKPKPKLPSLLLYEDGKPVMPEIMGPVKVQDQALLGHWQENTFRLQQRLTQAIEADDPMKTKAYAIASGIATEKVLLLAGRPTQLVANVHEVRHHMPDLMERLVRLAERVRPPTIKMLPSPRIEP